MKTENNSLSGDFYTRDSEKCVEKYKDSALMIVVLTVVLGVVLFAFSL